MSASESVPVAVSAPMSRLATPAVMQPRQPQPWSSSIFACHKDIAICCWTMFCPAVTFGTMANALDNQTDGNNDAKCCSYFVRQMGCASASTAGKYRARIRQKYNLVESPCSDFVTHCFLSPCALCQEYRHLKRFNVDLGRKAPRSERKKKSMRHQLLYKSVTRALNESTVADDGSVLWLTTHPGGPPIKPAPGSLTPESDLRPSTS